MYNGMLKISSSIVNFNNQHKIWFIINGFENNFQVIKNPIKKKLKIPESMK